MSSSFEGGASWRSVISPGHSVGQAWEPTAAGCPAAGAWGLASQWPRPLALTVQPPRPAAWARREPGGSPRQKRSALLTEHAMQPHLRIYLQPLLHRTFLSESSSDTVSTVSSLLTLLQGILKDFWYFKKRLK